MNRRNLLLFVLLSAIWGSSFLFIKLGLLGGLAPFSLVSVRLLAGATVMWVLALRHGLRSLPLTKTLLTIALLAFINNAIPFTFISWGELHIDSGMAAILNSTVPLFTAVLAHWMLADEPFTWWRGLGVGLGFVGVLVLFAPDAVLSPNPDRILGQLAVIVASLGYAAGSVLARKYLRDVSITLLTALQLSFAFLWVVGLALGIEQPDLAAVTPLGWFSVLWLGILGSGIAYLLFFTLLRSLGATPTTMVTYVIPLFALLFGALFLAESLHWQMVLALVLIYGGVRLVNKSTTSAPPLRVVREQGVGSREAPCER